MSPGNKIRNRLPKSRIARIIIGLMLVVLGLFGWLPIIGFWMIPLGLIVLSVDLPLVRRWRRQMEVKWGRRKNGGDKKKGPGG